LFDAYPPSFLFVTDLLCRAQPGGERVVRFGRSPSVEERKAPDPPEAGGTWVSVRREVERPPDEAHRRCVTARVGAHARS
jgi:hypothetical protein